MREIGHGMTQLCQDFADPFALSGCGRCPVERSTGEEGNEPHHSPLAGTRSDDGQIRAVDIAKCTGDG
jgi:hypothetical protein